jgi:hypothetical protein
MRDSSKLLFRRSGDGLQVWSDDMRRWTSPHFNQHGDVVFQADDAGDVGIFFSCRVAAKGTLICFDLDHIGDGAGHAVQFEKQPPIRRPSNEELNLTALLPSRLARRAREPHSI